MAQDEIKELLNNPGLLYVQYLNHKPHNIKLTTSLLDSGKIKISAWKDYNTTEFDKIEYWLATDDPNIIEIFLQSNRRFTISNVEITSIEFEDESIMFFSSNLIK